MWEGPWRRIHISAAWRLMLKMGVNSCYMLGFLTQKQAQQPDPPGEPVLSVIWQCGMQGRPVAGPSQSQAWQMEAWFLFQLQEPPLVLVQP